MLVGSMYIALEGVVGVGKSTQTELLTKRLAETYQKEVVAVREPGGTQIAQAIRVLVQATDFEEAMQPITDAYLYASARAQLIHGLINPSLEKGSIVISDRCVVSSLTIQGVAQDYGMQRVRDINEVAVCDSLPDIIIFLDLPVKEGILRTFDEQGDKRERKPIEFSKKIYSGYEKCFSFKPIQDRMKRVDASGTVEEVFERLKQVIESRM